MGLLKADCGIFLTCVCGEGGGGILQVFARRVWKEGLTVCC